MAIWECPIYTLAITLFSSGIRQPPVAVAIAMVMKILKRDFWSLIITQVMLISSDFHRLNHYAIIKTVPGKQPDNETLDSG